MDRREEVSQLDRDFATGPMMVLGLVGVVITTVCAVEVAESWLLSALAVWAGVSLGLALVLGIVRWATGWWQRPPPDASRCRRTPSSFLPPYPDPQQPPPRMHNYQPPSSSRHAPLASRDSDHVKTVLRELRQLCKELNARVDELEGWTPSMEMRQRYVDQVCADADLLTTSEKGVCR